jgi:hypothetical protein
MTGIRTITMVDIDAAGGIDPARLVRALALTVRRTERGRFAVTGGGEVHYVDLTDPQCERCDCGDHAWHQAVCQHLLACLLREGDERIVRAVERLVRMITSENERLRDSIRGQTIVLRRALKLHVALSVGLTVDELEFRRDENGESSDVRVTCRGSGLPLGRITRSASRPEFLPEVIEAAAAPRIAA